MIQEGAYRTMKKTSTKLLLIALLLISTFSIGIQFATMDLQARETCISARECQEQAREARSNIDAIREQEDEVNESLSEIQEELEGYRESISILEASIDELTTEITDLQNSITVGHAELAETEERIEELRDEVAERLRLVQSMGHQPHSFFVILSESESLTDLVLSIRFFSEVANTDAEIMEELIGLETRQTDLIEELYEEAGQLETAQGALEAEQTELEVTQATLLEQETALRDELYSLSQDRMAEEEAIAVAEAAAAVLNATPPRQTSSSGSGNGGTPSNRGMIRPIAHGRVSSEFGTRTLNGRTGHHAGIDLVTPGNPTAPILAVADGVVTTAQWHSSLGWYIIIEHNIDGQAVGTLYAHLSQMAVTPGTQVSQGQIIGNMGNTGHSFGAHLHFEVHPGGWAWGNSVNPRGWVDFPVSW